jgi:hypothetical protein
MDSATITSTHPNMYVHSSVELIGQMNCACGENYVAAYEQCSATCTSMPPTDQVKAVCTSTGFDKGEGQPGQYLEGTGSWSPVGFAVGPNDGKSYPTRGCETPACLAAMDICDPGKYQGQDLVRLLQRWTNPTKSWYVRARNPTSGHWMHVENRVELRKVLKPEEDGASFTTLPSHLFQAMIPLRDSHKRNHLQPLVSPLDSCLHSS